MSSPPRDGVTKSGTLLIQTDNEPDFFPAFCELTDTEWTAYETGKGERVRVGGVRLSKLIGLHIEDANGEVFVVGIEL